MRHHNPINYIHHFSIVIFVILAIASCKKQDNISECEESRMVLLEYTTPEGEAIKVYDSGNAYLIENGNCEFVLQYFDPDFFTEHYLENEFGFFIKAEGDQLLKPFDDHQEDFESYISPLSYFITDIADTSRFLSSFTLQSPSAKSVEEYSALRNCIIDGSCDFIDNRFDLVPDPDNAANQVLKLFAVAPSADMVTSKSSVSSTLVLFQEGEDFWFEARYYIKDVLPTTIADFESSHFDGGPGPRLIFRGNNLAIENKFNEKLTYNQNSGNELTFPLDQWVKVKVHFKYGVSNGIIQVWQDDQLIIDTIGQNMPLNIWVQDRIELGISATNNETTLYVDDIRFGHSSF